MEAHDSGTFGYSGIRRITPATVDENVINGGDGDDLIFEWYQKKPPACDLSRLQLSYKPDERTTPEAYLGTRATSPPAWPRFARRAGGSNVA